MLMNGIKDLMKTIKLANVTINLGFIGLNFAGGFSKENIFLKFRTFCGGGVKWKFKIESNYFYIQLKNTSVL